MLPFWMAGLSISARSIHSGSVTLFMILIVRPESSESSRYARRKGEPNQSVQRTRLRRVADLKRSPTMRMRHLMLAVTVGMLATGCGSKTTSKFDYDFDEAQRSKEEYKIAQHIDSAGSHECWVPRSELPKATLWTNLSEPPPVSVEQAIALAAEKGGHSPDQLGYSRLPPVFCCEFPIRVPSV